MPASNYPGRSHPYREAQIPRLSQAHDKGQFVRVKCKCCRVTRHYRPGDLIRVFGDKHVFELEHRFRCDKCGDKDSVSLSFISFAAREIPGLVIRELERIEVRHVPIWRDVKL